MRVGETQDSGPRCSTGQLTFCSLASLAPRGTPAGPGQPAQICGAGGLQQRGQPLLPPSPVGPEASRWCPAFPLSLSLGPSPLPSGHCLPSRSCLGLGGNLGYDKPPSKRQVEAMTENTDRSGGWGMQTSRPQETAGR